MNWTRRDLLKVLPAGTGAELGVFLGDFAAEILAVTRPEKLYLVDLFCGVQRSGDADGAHDLTVNMAEAEARVRARFAGRPEVEVVKGVSWDWLGRQAAGSLDWVYIDTDHSYLTTRLELRAARRAVQGKGVIAGHDYHAGIFPGVVRAVREFAAEHGLEVAIYAGDKFASYWMLNRGGGR